MTYIIGEAMTDKRCTMCARRGHCHPIEATEMMVCFLACTECVPQLERANRKHEGGKAKAAKEPVQGNLFEQSGRPIRIVMGRQ